MRGLIESGDLVTVEPLEDEPNVGDIVLCRVRGSEYLHLVKAVKMGEGKRRYLIGNNRGGTNGWIGRNAIFGVCTEVGVE